MKRTIFFISDGTGITAETLGRSLLTQFEGINFEQNTLPFIDCKTKAQEAVATINHASTTDDCKAIVFSTVVQPSIQAILAQSDAIVLDFFNTFVTLLATEFKQQPTHSVGRFHSLIDSDKYKTRIDAVNYALDCDDGAGIQHYPKADIILIGISRCGKTPSSLYMALQFGLKVANYPFTEDDSDVAGFKLPTALHNVRDKLFGLTIAVPQLAAIRHERRPNSNYADPKRCAREVQQIESLFQREHIPFINTTTKSIEEIATAIIEQLHIPRGQL